MDKKYKDSFKFKGIYSETVRLNSTGEVIDQFTQDNLIVTVGIQGLLQMLGSGAAAKTIDTVKIGGDVGTGTILAPQDPTLDLTAADQDVIYTIPSNEFFVSYPESNQVRFFGTINGASVMTSFPSQPNIIYTSAALYTLDGEVFSYKRFPARTISNLISIDVSWTLVFN